MGSLMFTPLLLLLPTTSVFYTFFTLIYSMISIARLCLQYLILILQWFPYAEVALWLVQPRRFPSGIWFKTLHQAKPKGSNGLWSLAHPSSEHCTTLVSSLGVETATIGTHTAAIALTVPLHSLFTHMHHLIQESCSLRSRSSSVAFALSDRLWL